MRLALIPLLLLAASALAAPPVLEHTAEQGVYVDKPTDWKMLVDPKAKNLSMSAGAATNLTFFWYPLVKDASPDKMLGLLARVVNEKLPLGKLSEPERDALPGLARIGEDQRGVRAHAKLTMLTIEMDVAMIAYIDEPSDRMIAAILVSTPGEYESLGGLDLLTHVVLSFRTDSDPLLPHEAWWWNATPPPMLVGPR